jgi:hypothetical protein
VTEITITITLGPWADDGTKWAHRYWVYPKTQHTEPAISIWQNGGGTFRWEIYDLYGNDTEAGNADTMALAKDASEKALAVWASPTKENTTS